MMLELRQRTSYRENFKELQVLTVPSLYILKLMTFVIKNPGKYQTNASVHSQDMRLKQLVSLMFSKMSSDANQGLFFLNKNT
jgi:hypothetical protein